MDVLVLARDGQFPWEQTNELPARDGQLTGEQTNELHLSSLYLLALLKHDDDQKLIFAHGIFCHCEVAICPKRNLCSNQLRHVGEQ